MSGRRPNVLLVMADQLAASALAAYGNAAVHAPHIDALARAGTVFANAYCTSPLCAPSRAAMLTGRPASAIGVYDNAAELRADTPTITHALRATGYGTALSGKMHFVGPDQLHGFEERLTSDVYPADFEWVPDWSLPATDRLPWYHHMGSVRDAGVAEAAMQTDYDDEVGFRAAQKLRDLARGGDRRPFFLVASFTNPHDPWEVRQRHWDLYRDAPIPPPHVPVIPRSEADPFSLRLRDMCGIDEQPLGEDDLRHARRAYHAAVSYLDERVGELLDVLRATGRNADTVVVLTADHGEMLGERGLWFKMSFFEGSARVPLLVAGPGIAQGRVDQPVSQLDLAPTLAELAGVPPPGDGPPSGRSLVALLTGGDLEPVPVISEYLAEGVTAPAVMIRDGRHKYIRCDGDPDQLYDLGADPLELRNLARERPQATAALRAAADERWDLARLHADVIASQRRRREVWDALSRGAYTPWDFQPWSDASWLYVRTGPSAGERPWRARPPGELPPAPER